MKEKLELLERAIQLHKGKHFQEAVQIYGGILDRFGPDSIIMVQLGRTEFEFSLVAGVSHEEHLRNAIEWIKRAIEIEPNDPNYYFEMGTMLAMNAGAPDYDGAIFAFRRAIELEPCHVKSLGYLASLYAVPGATTISLEEAINYCEKAVRIEPNASRWRWLADLYSHTDRESDRERALMNELLERREWTTLAKRA